MAHYWTGGPPAPRRITNVSIAGAFIEAPDEWPVGTILRLTLQPEPAGAPPVRHGGGGPPPCEIHGTVVRLEPAGFAVEFIVRTRAERNRFAQYLQDTLPPDKPVRGTVLIAE